MWLRARQSPSSGIVPARPRQLARRPPMQIHPNAYRRYGMGAGVTEEDFYAFGRDFTGTIHLCMFVNL